MIAELRRYLSFCRSTSPAQNSTKSTTGIWYSKCPQSTRFLRFSSPSRKWRRNYKSQTSRSPTAHWKMCSWMWSRSTRCATREKKRTGRRMAKSSWVSQQVTLKDDQAQCSLASTQLPVILSRSRTPRRAALYQKIVKVSNPNQRSIQSTVTM